MSSLKSIGSLGMLMLLLACSPALNWRSVRIDDQSLQASLPCKAERANRQVPWPDQAVDMSLGGLRSTRDDVDHRLCGAAQEHVGG